MSPVSSPTPTGADEIGRGPLSRGSAVVYWFVVLEALFALTTVPALAGLLFLERHWSNLPLAAALLIPVGPAVGASLFAWRRFADDRDLKPARHFWRGYRVSGPDALRVWVPSLAVLTVLAVNLANLWVTDAPEVFAIAGAVVAALALIWTAHALTVASLYTFRWRDVARMGVYFLFAAPLASLGVLSLAVLGGAVVYLAGDWLVVLLGSVFTFLLWRNQQRVVTTVARRFVEGAPEAVQAKPWRSLDAEDDADPDR